MGKIKNVEDLNKLFFDAEASHKSLLAEQRSNVLLVAGNHYQKRGTAFWRNVRNSVHLTREQKVRLTKNHIQKITKTYINNIVNLAPGIEIMPKNESEFHDQKIAEMVRSVWLDITERHGYHTLRQQLVKDYIELGEAWVKVFFDPSAGEFVGVEAETDEEGSFVVVDGVPKSKNVFTGDIKWERIHGFNVLTDPSARSWEEVRYVIIRKMVPTKNLKQQFKDDEKKLKTISDSTRQTFQLFDAHSGSYKASSKGLTMVREYYYRPSATYPNGYYFIATDAGILFEGELPGGLFPIEYVGFDEATTSARSFSIIKQIRPYQAQINFAASKVAEHLHTLGDDKLVIQAGTTLTPGATAHGVKAIKTSGPITHLPGRDGSQFLGYMQSQIEEMYFVANVEEDTTERPDGQLDPYSLLFRSMRDRKRYSMYAEKFERFLKNWCKLTLEYARDNYTENMLVQMIDKKERVNIAEFKEVDDLSFDIVVKPQVDSIETQLGKQISLNHLIQFAGNRLDPQDLGQAIRAMPFLNQEEMAGDLTIDYDNFKSDVLAMDRGEFVPANPSDNHEYYLKKLNWRMKRKDFNFLKPEVQQNYLLKKQQHQAALQQQRQEAALATSGLIPSGGFLTKVDLRIPDPADPTKTKILKLPIESIDWLLQKLEQQGTTQRVIQSLPENIQADIGRESASAGVAAPQAPAGEDLNPAPLRPVAG